MNRHSVRKIGLQLSMILALVTLVLVTTGANCTPPPRVAIGPTDVAPTITLNHLVIGGSGDVDAQQVTSTSPPAAPIKVSANANCEVPKLMITGGATSPTAVSSFSISVTPSTYGTTTVSQDIDSNNTAAISLGLLGTDGHGAQGGNPMEMDFAFGGCPNGPKFHVVATASSFHGVSTTLTEDLQGPCSCSH